ncbi:MAG: hypothetical protein U1E65_14760 [Myxococcota bacterium]
MSFALAVLVAATPAISAELEQALIEGNFAVIEDRLALLEARGARVDLGALGLVFDLTRLGRCAVLGPIPADEQGDYRSLRQLVRLERVRLERRLRGEAHAGTWLDGLVDGSHAPRDPPRRVEDRIRWPAETEHWPEEALEVRSEASHCAEAPSPSRPQDPKLRRQAEEAMLGDLTATSSGLPPAAEARLALAHLVSGATLSVSLERLLEILRTAEPERRPGGLLALAARAEASGAAAVAIAAYRAVIADAGAAPEEDSRARARLVGLLEPAYDEVLAVVRGARAARAVDAPELDYAEARALQGLGDSDALARFGRRFVRSLGRPDPAGLDQATLDLLYGYAVSLSPPEALGYAGELGPASEANLRAERLAAKARAEGAFDLAARIYDRLSAELGPRSTARAQAERARLLALRAEVELERQDQPRFAAAVGALWNNPGFDKRAAARALADLCTRVSARLADLGPAKEGPIEALLQAIEALGLVEGRYGALLETHRSNLLALQGQKPLSAKRPPVKVVGEVVVPRLGTRLRSPDVPTPAPSIPGFLVYEAPGGARVLGWPW